MGDPAGIGPEVTLKAATVDSLRSEVELVVFGDTGVLRRAAREMTIDLPIGAGGLEVRDVAPAIDASTDWGKPTPSSDRAQVEYVKAAFAAVRSGEMDAIVTAPINKLALHRAGVKWPGHTEMLAELSGGVRPLMMLAGPTLKVVPVTTHIALADVPRRLTQELIVHAIALTHRTMKEHFGLSRPRIGVAGLNPHAGEGGLFGREEIEIIRPAIEEANSLGAPSVGPLAPDTVFNRAMAGELDVVIGMYHDQALIPLKLVDFDRAVNVTLGLPIIRTSVDHGTAYDIAGQGVASASSMIEAIRLAAQMIKVGRRAQGEARQPSA
jgi:4-hydroxythreonine-4-phosphate dehydrogenase